MMLADQIAYVALVANDPAAAGVFERHFGLPRHELSSAAGSVPVFALGRSALALFPPGHPLVDGALARLQWASADSRDVHRSVP